SYGISTQTSYVQIDGTANTTFRSHTGWNGGCWSATERDSSFAYVLYSYSSASDVNYAYKTSSNNVVCVVGS
ncbi:hypothetical protein IJH74_01155, partial [Candidatus Saccharibacteria bacterium]|nr:hypothetical protein [Candidatus Saccharibacteria bacterium]